MESDQIHTAENTRAKITMRDQKETVHLYAKSFLTLEKVDDEKSQVSILIGKARFVVEPTTSKLSNLRRKFQIRTSNTFIGIRGTDLIVQTNGVITSVLTIVGLVGVANLLDPDLLVELQKNQATRVRRSEPPAPAAEVPPETIERILTTDQPEEWEDVEFEESPPITQAPVAEIPEEVVDEVKQSVEEAREEVQSATSDASISVNFTVTEQAD